MKVFFHRGLFRFRRKKINLAQAVAELLGYDAIHDLKFEGEVRKDAKKNKRAFKSKFDKHKVFG